MAGPFTAFFEAEHRALGAYFSLCLCEGGVDQVAFDLFRRRLLQRIAVEEFVLFPELERALGRPVLCRPSLNRDHAGLVAICAPTPHVEWVDGLWEQLEYHHAIEMSPEGFCAQCDELLAPRASELIERAAELPVVSVRAFEDGYGVRSRIDELLRATGVVSR